MRFESVLAHAFGPLEKQELQFAPGMNLVYGLNEAGKSSWHAALYVALCGLRRTRGGPGREEREFERRYRPWEGSEWRVAAVVHLEDGRRIELHHDLAARAGSAMDADLGVPLTPDGLVYEGALDGSRWLGLNRRAFLATACVRQGDIISVTERAAALQEHLQRAVAGAGSDATVARALDLIAHFRSDRVGTQHPSSGKPLRTAQLAVERAAAALVEAERRQRAYQDLLARVQEQRRIVEGTRLIAVLAARASAANAVHPEVGAAWEAFQRAVLLLSLHGGLRPAEGARRSARGFPNDATPGREPSAPPLSHADGQGSGRWARSGGGLLFAGLALALAGAGALLAGGAWIGWLLLALAAVAVALGAARREPALEQARAAWQQQGARLREERAAAERRLRAALRARGAAAGLEVEAAYREYAATIQQDKERAVQTRREAVAAAERVLGRLEGELHGIVAGYTPVADAAEALLQAEEELARVRRLEQTLDTTATFLRSAEAGVTRDAARMLAGALRSQLPAVTAGRYTEARVEPRTLSVAVQEARSGRWRDAALLSHGTREQIYLLLRVAMAQCLVQPGEVCPLILDDVTTQADATRTRAILDTLHTLSRERQIILFSQEDEVLAWARDALMDGKRDRVIELAGPR